MTVNTNLDANVPAPTPVYNNGMTGVLDPRTISFPTRRPSTTAAPLGDARPLPRPTSVNPPQPTTEPNTWAPLPSPAPKGSPLTQNDDSVNGILATIIPLLGSAFPSGTGGAGGVGSGGGGGSGTVPSDLPDVPAAPDDSSTSAGPSPLLWVGLAVAVVGAWFGYKAYKKRAA